jgi:hypothetical protein
MDGVDIFMSMSHREEDREWRMEDRLWRKEDRMWRNIDSKWRAEDRKWRRNDRRYRQLEDARRKTDEWVEMINDIANVSALLAGFASAALVEAPLDDFWACFGDNREDLFYTDVDCKASLFVNNYRIELAWVTTFAISTALVVVLMLANVLAAVQTATLLLQNYNKHPWRKHGALWDMIDNRWRWITIRFYVGMTLSLVSIASLVMMKFANSQIACFSALGCICMVSLWIFNDAIGLCYCCASCCPSLTTKPCAFLLCCGRPNYRWCGCCDAPAFIVMSSNIRSSYREHPLKGYHHGDDDIYRFEEAEDEGDNDLDEWRYVDRKDKDVDDHLEKK